MEFECKSHFSRLEQEYLLSNLVFLDENEKEKISSQGQARKKANSHKKIMLDYVLPLT